MRFSLLYVFMLPEIAAVATQLTPIQKIILRMLGDLYAEKLLPSLADSRTYVERDSILINKFIYADFML